jgi:hypothetical protein
MVMALVLAPVFAVVTAAPASAAVPEWVECVRTGFFPTSIAGRTDNRTQVPLTRTYDEKGVSNTWQPEPAPTIAAGQDDRWCVNAIFGSAMKVEYATPDGTKVLFVADQYTLATPSARCELSGPSAALLDCTARIVKTSFDDSRATFTVTGRGNAGGDLPTVTCSFLMDRGTSGGLVTGQLCRGVDIGFDDPARVSEDSGERRTYLCADVKLTQERSPQGSFLVIKATRCTAL